MSVGVVEALILSGTSCGFVFLVIVGDGLLVVWSKGAGVMDSMGGLLTVCRFNSESRNGPTF